MEAKNEFFVLNIRGETIFNVTEQSNWWGRLCLGASRTCEFHVTDNYGREVLRMVQPFTCSFQVFLLSSCYKKIFELTIGNNSKKITIYQLKNFIFLYLCIISLYNFDNEKFFLIMLDLNINYLLFY